MPTLSNRDNDILSRRGIMVRVDGYGVQVTLTSTGVAWILNFMWSSGNSGKKLTLSLLKDLAQFQAEKGVWRDLRFKAVPIQVYSEILYFQLVFYLNGTPPRAFLSFPPTISAIVKTFSVPFIDDGVFTIGHDQIVNIEFSDMEVEQLRAGGLIIVSDCS